MIRFVRSLAPDEHCPDTKRVREELRQDFLYLCAYCLLTEFALGGDRHFEVDHHRPRKHFRGQAILNQYQNLYWTCRRCNGTKHDHWPSEEELEAGERWLDPCEEEWYGGQHLDWLEDGELSVRSIAAKFTAEHLDLDVATVVRQHWGALRVAAYQYWESVRELQQLERLASAGEPDDYQRGRLDEQIRQMRINLETLENECPQRFGSLWSVAKDRARLGEW